MAAALTEFTPADTALMLVDLQNDFIHPDGAYGRAKKTAPLISPLADRLATCMCACLAVWLSARLPGWATS